MGRTVCNSGLPMAGRTEALPSWPTPLRGWADDVVLPSMCSTGSAASAKKLALRGSHSPKNGAAFPERLEARTTTVEGVLPLMVRPYTAGHPGVLLLSAIVQFSNTMLLLRSTSATGPSVPFQFWMVEPAR